jgi:aerobic carbon-monoxide dehydrogenase medium subunit
MIECEYIAPSSLEAALRVLGATSQPAMALAGGTQLLVHLRTGMMRPVMLVDLCHLDTLQYIRLDDYHIDIGAKTTLAQVETNPLIWRHVPLLTEMARQFGNLLVRAAATLGGNIASLTPVADAVVPLLALDASLLLQSVDNGKRRQQIASYITEHRQEKRHVHELITQVTIPVLPTNALSFYAKLGNRKAGAIPIASVASVITIEEQRIQEARIALGAITPLPLRAIQAEAVLHNETLPLRDQTIEHCLAVLITELREPLEDSVASAEYRVMMGKALVRKALQHLRFAEHDKQKKTREE